MAKPLLNDEEREELGKLAYAIYLNELSANHGARDWKDWDELTPEHQAYFRRVSIKGLNTARNTPRLLISDREITRRLHKFDSEQPLWTPAQVISYELACEQMRILQRAEVRAIGEES